VLVWQVEGTGSVLGKKPLITGDTWDNSLTGTLREHTTASLKIRRKNMTYQTIKGLCNSLCVLLKLIFTLCENCVIHLEDGLTGDVSIRSSEPEPFVCADHASNHSSPPWRETKRKRPKRRSSLFI
jgi:hypothetical protein